MLEICAIIAARNELVYLQVLIPYLLEENVDIVFVDNDSEDGSAQYVRDNFPVVRVEHLPYRGAFDLTEMLEVKREIGQGLAAQWLIHYDADEIMHNASGWGGLRISIEDADRRGFNVLNFHELVMLPCRPDVDDILSNNKNYYLFEPGGNRKMTTYKQGQGLDNVNSGGHIQQGDVRLYDQPMFLRHYIVRSQEHAWTKLANRRFAQHDIVRQWHGNRIDIGTDALVIPTAHEFLSPFPDPFDPVSVLASPISKHFWQWPKA